MHPFLITTADLSAYESRVANATEATRLQHLTALAWQLRERDTVRAGVLVDEIRAALSATLSSSLQASCQQARLLLIEGEADWLFARYAAGETRAREALRLFQQVDDVAGCADAHWLLGIVRADVGDTVQRDMALTECGNAARRLGDRLRIDLSDAALARYAALQDLPSAVARWGNRFDAPIDTYHPGVQPWIYDFWAACGHLRGDFATSLRYAVPMFDSATDTGQIYRAIHCTANIGSSLRKLHDHQAALTWTEKGIEMARRYRWPRCLGTTLIQTSEILRELHRFANAQELLLEAIDQFDGRRSSRQYGIALQYLGHLQIDLTKFDAALSTFNELEQLAAALNQTDLRMWASRGKAASLVRLEHTDAAFSAAQESLELARMQGDRYGQIEAFMLLAQTQAGSHARPEHSSIANQFDALHYLHEALAVAAQIDSYIVPGEIYDALAEQYAGRGQWQLAYDSSLRAKESREKSTGKKAVDRALAMQIRHESERARAEGEHQRNLARAEAKRVEALVEITDTLNRLSSIGQEITAQLDAAAIFRTLEQHVNGLLDATHLSIYLIDDDNASLDCMFGVDAGKPMARRSVSRTSTTSNVARCARERCEIIINREKTVVDNPAHIPGTVPSLSALFIPLEIGDRVLGVMSIQSPHAAAYGERELLIFRSLCAYGAIGLDNANAYRQLNATLGQLGDAQQKLQDRNRKLEDAYRTQERASLHDPLTGLHNRRFLTQHIEAEVAFALRANQHRNPTDWDDSHENTDLVFFMIDVDYFKQVNDTWGHGAGDLVLQELARRLKSVARTSDFVIRWGGEEFLVVARATNRGDAQHISERLRQAVLEQPFDIGQPEPLVKTCSIGFASFPFAPGQADALSWSEVVEVADQALYAAKRGGRNTWVGYYGTAKTDRSRLRAHLGSNLAELEPTGELRICCPSPNIDPKFAIGQASL